MNERGTCCDYGAGREKKGEWDSRFGMSEALIWANRTMCAVREWGQLGLRVRKGQRKKGRTWRGPGHWDSCWFSWLDPVTRTGHAPVRLPRVREGGQSSTRWVKSDTQVMDLDFVAS